MRLFRYCPLDGYAFEFFRRPYLRFCPPIEFNDPFEFLPHGDSVAEDWWRDHFFETYVKGKMTRRDFDLRYERNLSDQKRRLVDTMSLHNWEDARHIGVLCLSQVHPDDERAVLLWGHYSSGHRGLVIEFDESHADFIRLLDHNVYFSGAVDYDSAARPFWKSASNPVEDLVLKKCPHWAYEQEYRILSNLAKDNLECDEKGLRTILPLDPGAIKAIYFAWRSSDAVRRFAMETIRGGPLQHLLDRKAVWNMRATIGDFRVEIIPP